MAFAGNTELLGDVRLSSNGQLITSGNDSLTIIFDDLEHNGAEIRTSAGASTVIFGDATGAGSYTGTGTVFFEGDLRPGNSPGIIDFEGDVVFGLNTESFFEIAGLDVGEFDQLLVQGELNLGGELTLQFLDGFDPLLGDSFDLLDWGTLEGSFHSLNLPTLNAGLRWDTGSLYSSGTLSISNVPEPTSAALLGAFLLGWSVRRRRGLA